MAGKPRIEENFNEYPNTPNIIVKPLGFNNIVDGIEFEVCSETKDDTQKRMLSDEDEDFFDSCSKKSRDCIDLEHSISAENLNVIEASDTIVNPIAANINSINVNLANSVNKEKSKGPSIQKSTDTTGKVANSQSDHQITGKTDYRVVIVRCKEDRKVFMNPSKNLKMINNSIFRDHIINDSDGIEVRGNGRSLKFKIKSDSYIEHDNNLKLGDIDITVRYPLNSNNTVGVIGSFDKELSLREDVLPNLKVVGCNSKIVELKRLRNSRGETEQLKIVFDGHLPNKVGFDNLTYVVRKFEFHPKRCFRCSMYGHSADSCNKKITCAFCKQNHFLSECPKKKAGTEKPICLQCGKNHVSCTKECEFYKKAKEIENMRQDGKITFDEAKKYYLRLNSGKLSIKISENKNDESNLNVGYPKLRSNRKGPKYELNCDIEDNEDSDYTYAELNNNNSFSDLSEEEMSETDTDSMWWDNNLESETCNLKKRKKRNKSKHCGAEAKLIESNSRYYLDSDDGESNRETNNNNINQKVIRERKTPKKVIFPENNEKTILEQNYSKPSRGKTNNNNNKLVGKLIMNILKKVLKFYKAEDKDYFEFFEIMFSDVAALMELFS